MTGVLRSLVICLALLIGAAGPCIGQEPEPQPTASRIHELNARWLESARNRDWDEAEKHLKALAALEPDNPNHAYNLACALAQQDRLDEATAALLLAIARGFTDRTHLESDPDLQPLRQTDEYRTLLDGWDEVVAAAADARLKKLLEQLGPEYASHRDDDLRLVYISAFDPVIFARAREEITRLARWWDEHVAPPGEPDGDLAPPYVTVWLPTRMDFLAWARSYAGENYNRIGGVYQHDEKRLIAQGIGANLRHEFWHVLHWRDMTQRNQRHPIWIMEGLCSLVEDVQPGPAGEMVVLPSWRTNMVRNLARAGRLTDWERLCAFDRASFLSSTKLANYAQARAVFMYLAEQGLLREWYATYTAQWDEDPSGLTALIQTLGGDAREAERAFQSWARALPEAPEQIEPGMPTLPFHVEAADGQGLTMTSLPQSRSARRAGLKIRDVITDIDGEPVREMYDLARIMSQRAPGQTVTLSIMRRGEHFEVSLELVRAQ